ncbi:hypothetical protein [Saccharothrix australiensis]|uniref:Tetratricopeptide repeat protein n=1 Tax=Saccharothrix australiensis TaxID=2072 RepID=A0A495VLQ1_9PSEU|nr:hypothetical protein [Saccharothrix australiensis]RKT49273.1 hypothetical protein C8E97_6769 [Saccharothrix australiensis]RKT49373.1 hypothetical protein C8E97_6752 [Saccharothrix australiensis]
MTWRPSGPSHAEEPVRIARRDVGDVRLEAVEYARDGAGPSGWRYLLTMSGGRRSGWEIAYFDRPNITSLMVAAISEYLDRHPMMAAEFARDPYDWSDVDMMRWYAHAALAADEILFPATARLTLDLGPVPGGVPLPFAAEWHEAVTWLGVLQPTLAVVQQTAGVAGRHEVIIALASASRHVTLRHREVWPLRLDAESVGIDAAEAVGDRGAQLHLRLRRADTARRLGQHVPALTDLQLVLAADDLDPVRRQEALVQRALVRRDQGRHGEADRDLTGALHLAEETASAMGQAVALAALSRMRTARGDCHQGLKLARRELAVRARLGVPTGTAYAHHSIALALQGLGEHAAAVRQCDLADAIYQQTGGPAADEADLLDTLARSLDHQPDGRERAAACRTAAALIRQSLGLAEDEQPGEVHG